jgi:hypothetical protein
LQEARSELKGTHERQEGGRRSETPDKVTHRRNHFVSPFRRLGLYAEPSEFSESIQQDLARLRRDLQAEKRGERGRYCSVENRLAAQWQLEENW